MSEYWVSKKKYFCKYCDIYIADDAPSRQQHENGLRHKGNLDRFIRGLYKAGEQRKKDEIEEKRELARVEQAAQAAYAQDVATGCARPATTRPVASTSTAPRKPAPKPSNPYTNYSTAASLGYADPDVERLAAETERRRTQGVVGEWEVVNTINPTPALSDDGDEKPDVEQIEEAAETAGVKRAAESPADVEDARSFKLRKKGWMSGLNGGYDPDSIPIKLKKKEEVREMPESTPAPVEVTSTSVVTPEASIASTGAPKWTKVQWKRASETTPEVPTLTTQSDSTEKEASDKSAVLLSLPAKDEFDDSAVLLSSNEETKASPVKLQEPSLAPETSATSGIFRKRKIPAGGNRGRRL